MNLVRWDPFVSYTQKYYKTCKPDSVPDKSGGYHLSGMLLTQHLSLPTHGLRRAAVRRPYIWHFSTQGLPLCMVAHVHRSLLHYFFTLTAVARGGYFLWHCLYPASRGLPVR